MFDAHFHIIDPQFPLVENNGFLPQPFTIADYRARMDGFGVDGGAVVSGSFQENDSTFLVAALAEFGEGYVGVIQLDPDATDEDILELDRAGVRALRFNLKRGAIDIAGLTHQALRAHQLAGWHAELYVDGSLLPSLEPVLAKLPAVSIDHLGMSDEALPYLLDLVDRGARIKATGFGRLTFDIPHVLRRIHSVSPEALMFGSDLPGTRASRCFEAADLDMIAEAVGGDLHNVLEANARQFYRLPPKEPEDIGAPPMPLFRARARLREDRGE
ncbi:amidohydrolase [Antrihabitans sp. YC2-6]|uniref:amidohydrolase family protein n=1 Tax=Antrihabitans sp. YC2-6 TaxID=2799498 RepID=UPI0018F29550|nr:amidohydrolase family protein [Antrihabitans sp. YC2-6]MBJ8348543.1 amidohydrolase family protein [Antrihabitans sp. YC2-6]